MGERQSLHGVARSLDPTTLAWPEDAEIVSDYLEGNQHYIGDIRLARWQDVERALDLEARYLPRLAAAADAEQEWLDISDEIAPIANGIADDFFIALDPGVASATLALGAMACIPFTSCNGGLFGGTHTAKQPTVFFFARPEHAPLILGAATKAAAGVEQDVNGRCRLYADSVDAFRAFAKALYDSR